MAVRRKTFKAGTKLQEFEPIEFEFGDQTFHCKPAVQGSVLLDFVAHADSERGGDAAAALFGFFADVLKEGEYERFQELLRNEEVIFTMDEIGEIVAWLVEEYTSRPTTGPGNSANGQSTSGPTSTERD